MGNIYSRTHNIRKTLEEFSALQRWCLRRTLVCAYVRESDGAFRDPALLDLLRKMRAALLTSQERFGVNMLDVPEGDDHKPKSRNWWPAAIGTTGVVLAAGWVWSKSRES